MKYFAHIEIEFDAEEGDAYSIADEYAEVVQALPSVLDAWVAIVEEHTA